jgi:hypothetical protein
MLAPRTRAGKVNYMAQEVYESGAFDESSDLWCLGVSLWMMLFGIPLYQVPIPNHDRFYDEIRAGNLRGLVEAWQVTHLCSPEGVDLIARMLHVDPACRLSIPEILAHPWMLPALEPVGGVREAVAAARTVLRAAHRINESGAARDGAEINWELLLQEGDDEDMADDAVGVAMGGGGGGGPAGGGGGGAADEGEERAPGAMDDA